jgi:hypothetical protein
MRFSAKGNQKHIKRKEMYRNQAPKKMSGSPWFVSRVFGCFIARGVQKQQKSGIAGYARLWY